jgi:hypothetical protein
MSRISLTCVVAAVVAASGAFAQSASAPANTNSTAPRRATRPPSVIQPSATLPQGQSRQTQTGQSGKPSQSATETRPDARYPHPSGQDSQPDHSSGKTKLAAVGSKKDKESGQDQKPKATGRSKQVDQLAKRNTYTGSNGSKGDPGTACSTARPTSDGGVDCGTSGNSATMGKIVTKSH